LAKEAPLTVAVYDVPPYGHLEPDGSIDGVSIDLWRRAAEVLRRDYRLIPVAQMETILEGSPCSIAGKPTPSSTASARSSI
jgi:hypothetical protein